MHDDLQKMYRDATAAQMAAEAGVSHATMRQRLCRAGAVSPRRAEMLRAARERRNTVRSAWGAISIGALAWACGVKDATVRRYARRMGLDPSPGQIRLFGTDTAA